MASGKGYFGLKQNKRKNRSLIESSYIRQAIKPNESETEKISFSSTGYYDENTNVKDIDKYVKDCFNQRTNKIPDINNKIKEYQNILDNETLKIVEQKTLQSKIKKCEEEKLQLLSDKPYKEYLEKIQPFMDEWNRILKKEGPYIRFGEERKFCPDKLACIRNFIQIASEYVPLNLILKPTNSGGLCPYCRNPYLMEEGKIICEECEIYQDSLVNDADFNDLSRINGSSGGDYINQETFIKAMANYQGQQHVNFPESIFKDVKDYCFEHGISIKTLTQETTRPIFKKLEYSDYYDDINLFLFLFIEKPLPDISAEEHLILQDYDLFSQKYNEVKEGDRDSALGAQYVLYILMQRRGIPCNKEDLRLADTPTIRKSNDNIARRVFEALGWDFTDTI